MTSEEIVGQLKTLLGIDDEQSALETVNRILNVAAQQSHFLNNLSVITLVMGPQGLGYYNTSPILMETEEGLDVLEQGLQDFQRIMLAQRKAIKAAKRAEAEQKE